MEEILVQLLELFKAKPYLLSMGAGLISSRYGYSIPEIKRAKSIFRKSTKNTPKILIFDIETAPMKAFVWQRWKENISLDQTISEWFIICWSAKWLGNKKIMGDCLTSKEIVEETDSRIVLSLWKLFNEADIIIAHNGKKFDIPKANSRFIINELPPCSPYQIIDTLEVCKRVFGFSSNKLDALATYFGIVNKDETDFNLWKRCLNGEPEALTYMFNYNKKDVEILEKVYLVLRPWIPKHPNVSLIYNQNKVLCPVCGSEHVVPTNQSIQTYASKFALYRCESCGAYSRGRNNIIDKATKKSILVTV